MGTDLNVADRLADRSGALLSSDEAFGLGGENCARFSFAAHCDRIEGVSGSLRCCGLANGLPASTLIPRSPADRLWALRPS